MLIEKKPKIHITNKSILDLSVDTIVNSAAAGAKVGVPFHGKKTLDYMVYDAAGYKEMLAERKKIGYLKTGPVARRLPTNCLRGESSESYMLMYPEMISNTMK